MEHGGMEPSEGSVFGSGFWVETIDSSNRWLEPI